MKKLIAFNKFEKAFKEVGREDNFSLEALKLLYNHYKDNDIKEFDVIDMCCEWVEYANDLESLKYIDFTEGIDSLVGKTIVLLRNT